MEHNLSVTCTGSIFINIFINIDPIPYGSIFINIDLALWFVFLSDSSSASFISKMIQRLKIGYKICSNKQKVDTNIQFIRFRG